MHIRSFFSIIGQNDNLTSAFQEIEAEVKIVLGDYFLKLL
jgi:hypothetical protein